MSYSFVLIGDPQLGMVANEAGNPSEGKPVGKLFPTMLKGVSASEVYQMEIEHSKTAVNIINAMNPKPKFAVVLGDLVNTPPSQDYEENKKQVADFKDIFSKLDKDIKLVCVCGNHDVGNEPSEKCMDIYRGNFGPDYFSFKVEEDKYIVINSQYYESSENCKQSGEKHEKWLASELEDSNCRHKMIFGHIAPFIFSPDEHEEYFNYDRETRKIALENAINGGVSKWFCGHYHRNAQGLYEFEDKILEVVTSAAIGGNVTPNPNGDPLAINGVGKLMLKQDVSGIRIVEVKGDEVIHTFKTIQELKQNR